MRFGCCLPGASFVPQMNDNAPKKEAGNPLEELKRGVKALFDVGYDFVELTVGSVANLSQADFEDFSAFLKKEGRVVEVFNSFVPPVYPLLGDSVDEEKIENYLDLAVSRVKECGGEIIIFGSGAARRRPEGFPVEKGEEQLYRFLELCEKYAAKYGVIVCIEPLNSKETNIILSVREGYDIWKKANHPHVWLLADCFHMGTEGESFDSINYAADALKHVHIADLNRVIPGDPCENGIDFAAFFKKLREVGYTGRVSTECPLPNLVEDSRRSLLFTLEAWNK
ncbi:MAG: sugar phosphate isomerase/epimerase [Clostridia bacterium]|nr:sugar phosphate isomerase/epimerase [Clostridia bacterium]